MGCEKELQPVQIAVSTGDATNITTNSASIQVSMDKNDLINEIGVFCSTDSLFNSNTVNKSSIQTITGTHFNFQLSNLSDGTKYFYKAYASGKSNSIYGITKSFTTEQLQLSTSINNIEAGDLENTYSVKINSNTDWHASSNQNWCEVSPNTGTTNSTINILLKANTTTSARQAIVTVTAGNKEQKITINQKGCHENLAVSSNYFSVSPENKSYNFVIYTNMSWEASSDQSWCVLSSSSGNGENTLSFNVSENTTGLERKAVVKVKSGSLTQEITIIQQSKSATLSVSTNIFSVNADRNTYNFSITSNLDWTITSDQSWCTPSIAAGSNNQTVSFVVSENTSAQERTAMISVKAGTLLQQITVTQTGTNQTLAVSRNSFLFGSEKGHGEFTISSNTNWNISSDKSWCSVATTSGSNNKTVSFLITENTSTQRRSAIITVETSSSSIQIVVTQEGKIEVLPNLSVSPESISVTADEQTSSFSIASNTNWTISSNQTWCTPSVTSGSGDKTITCSIDENTQSQTRTATITIRIDNLFKTITVTQEGMTGMPQELKVSSNSLSASANEQTVNFDILSNMDWTISSDQTWCIPSVTSGSGDKEIKLSLKENKKKKERIAIVSVKAGNLFQQVTLKQIGADAYLSVSTESLSAIAHGQSLDFLIWSNSDWNISSNQLWYKLSATTGEYNKNISVDFSENSSSEMRTDVITINSGSLSKRIVLTQIGNNISIIDIPDNNFKSYLVKEFDIDNDNEISNYEASLIKSISCENRNIKSIKGIESCVNLTFLCCENNSIENIDITKNESLKILRCGNNNIKEIDTSNNINILTLHCGNNPLVRLDLINNPNLDFLSFTDTDIKSIDLSKNPLLTWLTCSNNRNLEELDLSNNIKIETLICWNVPKLKNIYFTKGHIVRSTYIDNSINIIYK